MKYRKLPVEVEAVKVPYREYADAPLVFDEVPDWLQEAVKSGKIKPVFKSEDYWYFEIYTLEGVMLAKPDDMLIRGVRGEIYPCDPDIFAATYEAVEELEI